jgi:hypothetical protein
LIPDKEDVEARYILICKELSRIHQRAPDYRNAFLVMNKCVKKFSNDPYVNSRMGRFCLEIGQPEQATKYFDVVESHLKNNDGIGNSLVDDLLGDM